MDFHAAGYQPFPAALTSSRQYRSSALGFHARAKPELALPGAFRRLVCSFHLSRSWNVESRKGYAAEKNCQTRQPPKTHVAGERRARCAAKPMPSLYRSQILAQFTQLHRYSQGFVISEGYGVANRVILGQHSAPLYSLKWNHRTTRLNS
jgi:hypothetical protein